MEDKKRKLLLIQEIRNHTISRRNHELMKWFVSHQQKYKLESVFLISGDIEETKTVLDQYDLGQVCLCDVSNADLIFGKEVVLHQIETEIRKRKPDGVILSDDDLSKDLGPVLAECLNMEFINGVIQADLEGEREVYVKPVYGGSCRTIHTVENRAAIVILKGVKVQEKKDDPERKQNLYRLQPLEKKDCSRKIISRKDKIDKIIPIEDASIVIAGGYGIRKKEDMELLYKLAETIGAGVGGTRAITEKGFIRRGQQIGQSGKSIRPDYLFIFGASGQRQFTAGFEEAGTVIAVNKNPEATIFRFADYGIVGDLYKVIPYLTERLGELVKK